MIVPQVVVAFEMTDQAVMAKGGAAPELLEKRLNDYKDFQSVAETEFNQFLIRINAEEDSSRIFLNFCDAIENSVWDMVGLFKFNLKIIKFTNLF